MTKSVVLLAIGLFQFSVSADTRVITLMEGEQFWGGCVLPGHAVDLPPFQSGQ